MEGRSLGIESSLVGLDEYKEIERVMLRSRSREGRRDRFLFKFLLIRCVLYV